MTVLSASSGSGRCSVFASSQAARIQTSRSSSVVKMIAQGFEAELGPPPVLGGVRQRPAPVNDGPFFVVHGGGTQTTSRLLGRPQFYGVLMRRGLEARNPPSPPPLRKQPVK